MNIIFDNKNNQIIVQVASGDLCKIKIVKPKSDFTKIQPIKEYIIPTLNKDSVKAENKI